MIVEMRSLPLQLFVLILLSTFACAQGPADKSDLTVVGRIKLEAFENSQLMDTAENLTDRYGPRLTASPEWREAAEWVIKRLQSYGLENVHLEKWGSPARGWSLKKASLEMIEPRYSALDAAPLAWSDVTHDSQAADVILAPYGTGRRVLDPKQAQQELDKFMAEWKGKLQGKIILFTPVRPVVPPTKPLFQRYAEDELVNLAAAPVPFTKAEFDPRNLKFPDTEDPETLLQFMGSLPPSIREQLRKDREAIAVKRAKFLKDEGVVAVIERDQRAHDGLLFAEAAGPYDAQYALAPPTFVVTQEQYARMFRLVNHKVPVKVRAELEANVSSENQDAYNVVGEIPGTSKKDEIIMIGAHFDSWHTGTGATDNAAGSAVMVEVMRILKTLGLPLQRTVRIALWSGEEQGLLGSRAYVKEHFGDPETMKLTEQHAKLAGYFNLDNGSGKIRGVYLQGNDAMRPVFEAWLAPFRDQGVSTITIRNTGGTDHLSFDAVGLAGFQFIQDPLDYGTVTHHSDVDTFDHLQAPDLMQASAVIASVVYQAANRDQMLPRKNLPRAWAAHTEPRP
jgi:hypothetical protein